MPYEFKTGYREKKSRNKLYFGFELEVEHYGWPSFNCPDNCCEDCDYDCPRSHQGKAERRIERREFIHDVRGDGSLSDEAAEIVSHPLSWKWIKQNKKRLAQLLAYCKKMEYKSMSGCGLHVHVNRRGIGDKALRNLQRFIYGNPKFVHRLSGRSYGDLQDWAQLYGSHFDDFPDGHHAALDIEPAAGRSRSGSSVRRWNWKSSCAPLSSAMPPSISARQPAKKN